MTRAVANSPGAAGWRVTASARSVLRDATRWGRHRTILPPA